MFRKNRAIAKIIIGTIFILICANCKAGPREQPAFSSKWPKSSEMIYNLYRALNSGQEIPELMLKKVDDTLTYGQFWPNEKFEIIRRDGKKYVPLAIWTGEDTCEYLRQYIEYDPKIRMFSNTQAKYVVPVEDFPKLNQLDCIKNYETANIRIPAIDILTMRGRGSGHLLYSSISEDYYTGNLVLSLSSQGMYHTGGYEIKGNIERIDSSNSVKVRTFTESPKGIVTQAFAYASGSISFMPPADNFNLDLDGDNYEIILGLDSIYISPNGVCDNIIVNRCAPRMPPESFALVFDTSVVLENPRILNSPNNNDYNILMKISRDSIIAEFNFVGASFALFNRADIGKVNIEGQDSANFIIDTTMVGWQSGKRSTRYSIFFNYHGDRNRIFDIFKRISTKYHGMDLLWVRENYRGASFRD